MTTMSPNAAMVGTFRDFTLPVFSKISLLKARDQCAAPTVFNHHHSNHWHYQFASAHEHKLTITTCRTMKGTIIHRRKILTWQNISTQPLFLASVHGCWVRLQAQRSRCVEIEGRRARTRQGHGRQTQMNGESEMTGPSCASLAVVAVQQRSGSVG